jgi:isoquinoline 1-oxidoreductase beta subunit
MNSMSHDFSQVDMLPEGRPTNLSRRSFVGSAFGALVLGVALPHGFAHAQGAAAPAVKPGTRVPAFLEIRSDGTVLLRSPFIEGGQGIFTSMAQIVGEELDVDPSRFVVECAPPGPDYALLNGMRYTGGSSSVRRSNATMRKLGAAARQMLLQAAATRLGVPVASLSTEPGRVLHAASSRGLEYGALAADAAAFPVPEGMPLRAEKDFRWIGRPVARLDVRDKSTGKAAYTIDVRVDGMLQAAVQHAPRLGGEPGDQRGGGKSDAGRALDPPPGRRRSGGGGSMVACPPCGGGAEGDLARACAERRQHDAGRFLLRANAGELDCNSRPRDCC